MRCKGWFGGCPKRHLEAIDPKKQELNREITKAKFELSAAETNYAWADPEYVDAAIAQVDMARARYQALVREYKSLYSV